MSEQEYKAMSIREFTKAAEIYDSGHAGLYEDVQGRLPARSGRIEPISVSDAAGCWLRSRPDDRAFAEGIPGQTLHRN